MNQSTTKPYRLCKDIENPEYDKRCAYGHRSFAVFKAGTFFEGRPARLSGENNFSPAYVKSKEWSHISGDIAALILGNSEASMPQTWHELATLDGGWHHLAPDMLEALIKTGVVSLDQLAEVLKACISVEHPG